VAIVDVVVRPMKGLAEAESLTVVFDGAALVPWVTQPMNNKVKVFISRLEERVFLLPN
jgi:hypothetical protein